MNLYIIVFGEAGVEFHGFMCGETCVELHDMCGEARRGLNVIVCRNTFGEFQIILCGEIGVEI